jgi:chromate reductase, NAD(P)H dehydrogenase (quinone)
MTVRPQTRILLVSGSTRGGSTNTAALRTIEAVVPDGVAADLYDGLAELPAFNPDDDGAPASGPDGSPGDGSAKDSGPRDGGRALPAPVAALRERIAVADAVVFCTPEYAGTLPGSFKNLLDWTVGGGELYGKPVAWINVAGPGRGGGAQATLETVLGYVGAQVIERACRRLPVARDWVGPDGVITDPGFRAEMTDVGAIIGGLAAS